MNKLNLYPPDDVMVAVEKIAKELDRSLSFVSIQLLKDGLRAQGGFLISEDSKEEVRKMAAIKSQTGDEVVEFLVQYALKEIKRQREKAKSRGKKENEKEVL